MITEADTCRKYVLPKLKEAGWTDDQISEQKTFTDGQIIVIGDRIIRRKQRRADYLLRYSGDRMIAVVEAKAAYKNPGDGLQQAKEYAQMLDLKFAYSTNGHAMIEHDFTTGLERSIESLPSPEALWERFQNKERILDSELSSKLLSPLYHLGGKPLRYYNEVAVNRVVQSVLLGKRRVLLTMATGTGKTIVAFQVIWKLWNAKWNRAGESRRPRVLYLADRNILIDDPKDKVFAPFGDARWKIQGEAVKSREIYFATYQAIAKDERRPGLYKEYPPDFFDLIVVDECHRGSAKDESNWKDILEYFDPAYQLGMTATPLREDNRDTYKYFGNPVYTYTLKQGIKDGFLAPFIVHRIVTDVDALGWRPSKGEVDRYGREIPDEEYETGDFERVIALKARTEAMARRITDFLKETDRYSKSIVFCVDMEHAEEMRMALSNANADLVREYPDYVARVVSEEGSVGIGYLNKFQDLESKTPVILTTSKLLTTGVDMPTCKNIIIAKVIKSMTDFKQIIGRGTRVRDDYGKLYFNILDFTPSATRLFADPQFDGEPALLTEEEIDSSGKKIPGSEKILEETKPDEEIRIQLQAPTTTIADDSKGELHKYYVDGGFVKIAAEVVYELGEDGRQMRVMKYTDYTRENVKSMFTKAADLRSKWGNPEERAAIMSALEERGVSLEKLMEVTKMYDADRFDLLCHVAFDAPLRTRRERAEALRRGRKDFFDRYSPIAKEILDQILDKYVEYGTEQFVMPDILKVAPIDKYGNVIEISSYFGGADRLRTAVNQMQNLLYQEA